MFFILSFFWFIRETKAILFWLYLWQLKEYHIGRFLDHFRTKKGKKLFLNKLNFLKLLFFFSFFIYPFFLPFLLLVLYGGESLKALKDFFQKKLKTPVLTKKTVFLILTALTFQILFVFLNFGQTFRFLILLLLFDILTPAIVSGIVLLFQPLTVLWRCQIIKKAKSRRAELKNLLVIGITGSYGKTSTKEFLATILGEKFKVLKTLKHQNSEVGISQCILNDLRKDHEIFIVEMGAYNRGGIKLLCDIAKPKIGILTGINEQHMVLFGSQENIIKTKYELIESLPENGLAIFNGSNPHTFRLYLKTKKPKKVYRFQAIANQVEPDIFAKDILMEKETLSFKVFTKDKKTQDFKINLLGAQNTGNILAAILVARELGMTLEEIARACQKIKPWQSGIELKKGKGGLNIIDATYSTNPAGVISHLSYLKIWPGKKVIIMPCLIELGKISVEVHKRIGDKIGGVCNMAIITTKERFKEIKTGAIETEMKKENILFIKDPKEILERIQNFCSPNDVVLLESRVPKKLVDELISK